MRSDSCLPPRCTQTYLLLLGKYLKELFIHPFFFFPLLILRSGCWAYGAYLSYFRVKCGYTQDTSTFGCGASRDISVLELPVKLICMLLRWSGGNQSPKDNHTGGVRTCKLHIGRAGGKLDLWPCCIEVMLLHCDSRPLKSKRAVPLAKWLAVQVTCDVIPAQKTCSLNRQDEFEAIQKYLSFLSALWINFRSKIN